AVAFAGDSQVVGGYDNGDIRRWEIEDGQQKGPAMKAGNRVNSIVVSQDGRWIVSGDRGKALVWDGVTHTNVLKFPGNVWAVDISSDSVKIASVMDGKNGNGMIDIRTTSGDRLLPHLPHCFVEAVKFSPDGSRFATASRDFGFRVYSTHDGSVLFDSGCESSPDPWPVTPLAWSSDGQQLFVANPGKIICLDVSNSSCSEWSIHQTQSRVSIASNGRFIACTAGPSVSLWDCVSHNQIGNIITLEAEVNCAAVSPSGQYLACGVGRNITIHNLTDVLPPGYFYHRVSAHALVILTSLTIFTLFA
ncbi:hypothetical protein PISMIDRAFT_104501, partial [Pisolithus microcarpus 441]